MSLATIVDLVLAVVVLEMVALIALGRRIPSLPPAGSLLPNLAAGLFLVLALRSAVHDGGVLSVAAFLALGGVAHLLDLWRRTTASRR